MSAPFIEWFNGTQTRQTDPGAVTLSDILVLSVKEKLGKLVKNTGNVTATGDIATLTASSGKDMYLGTAKVSMSETSSGGFAVVVLKINGVVVETGRLGVVNAESRHYQFTSKGFKVAATQIIKIEATTASTASIDGTLICFEEDTGVNPLDDF